MSDLVQDAESATATIADPQGNEHRVTAKYVIAADGPRSATRDRLGIATQGPGALGTQLGIYFHADLREVVKDNPSALYWVYNPDVQGVIISLDGGQRWHLLFGYDGESETVEDYPPERCEAIVRGMIGRDDVDIDIRSVLPWQMRAAVADRFRDGRIFLIGDAAHTMPVTGGMGMNTGIGDAHNLAWKLQAVLRGWADPALLDTFETERVPVGRRNTENSTENAISMVRTGLAGIMTSDPQGFAAIEDPEGAELRECLGAAIPGQLAHFSFDGLSFGYSYDSDSIIADGTPEVVSEIGHYTPTARPGARAPHLWLQRDGEKVTTIDLSDGQFLLLASGAGWAEAARQAAEQLGVPLNAWRVGGPDADLGDPEARFAVEYEVGDSGAVLVRPDGHVAWRTTEPANDGAVALLTRNLEQILARTS